MNIEINNSGLDDATFIDAAPEMVATECQALARQKPVDPEEVVCWVEYGLADGVNQHFDECCTFLLSRGARRAVVRLVAKMMIAQHEYDVEQREEDAE